jgi:hypothetical protein
VFIVFNLLSERVRVSVHQGQDSIVSLLAVDFKIMASYTIAPFTGKVKSKAIAIKFQALGLFTIARNSSIWIFLFDLVVTDP